jgi:hypothetical protein
MILLVFVFVHKRPICLSSAPGSIFNPQEPLWFPVLEKIALSKLEAILSLENGH